MFYVKACRPSSFPLFLLQSRQHTSVYIVLHFLFKLIVVSVFQVISKDRVKEKGHWLGSLHNIRKINCSNLNKETKF